MTAQKLRQRPLRLALSGGGLALALALGTAGAQTSYIYLQSNNAARGINNSVYGFSSDGMGNLTMLPGSPFPTGGTGVGAGDGSTNPFDADQQLIARRDGSLLFAVNGHSNDIAVLTVNADGTLNAVPGSPFPSGGQNPASVGLLETQRETLVVVNKNEDARQDIAAAVP
ncbi:MAG TPA: hypothetical protein VH207_08925, partial [Chthoniobacterales bacterium]|nr:hypothetical protein [Chthoniobacterales bacterium]